VNDVTNGSNQSVSANLGPKFYDGTTTEWIDERPGTNFLNYSETDWSNAKSEKPDGTWIDYGNANSHHAITATSNGASNGTVLSVGQPELTTTSFHDVWKHCN